MIKEYNVGKNYTQAIKFEGKKIISVFCECPHFALYPNNWEEAKTICWHLKEVLNPSTNKKLSETKKELLRKFVNYKCENCEKKDEKLTPHRIKRGRDGGKYELRNIKMVCNKCHKLIHSGEFR